MHACKSCEEVKPATEFRVHKRGYRIGSCKPCERAYQRAWSERDPETYRRRKRESMARLRRAVGIGVDMAKPYRVQLSRRKGWRMPDNTVKVDRSTKWGNPFVVGVDGNAARSVELYRIMLGGHFCISCKTEFADQKAAVTYAGQNIKALRGKNLACWCRAGQPCHADVLLEIANQ